MARVRRALPAGPAEVSDRVAGGHGQLDVERIWMLAHDYGDEDLVASEMRAQVIHELEHRRRLQLAAYYAERWRLASQLAAVIAAFASIAVLAVVVARRGMDTGEWVAFAVSTAAVAAVSIAATWFVAGGRQPLNQTFNAQELYYGVANAPVAQPGERGGLAPIRRGLPRPEPVARRIPVYVFLDTDDGAAAARVFEAVDDFIELLGYDRPEVVDTVRGSILRRAFAAIKRGLTSKEVKERMAEGERALQLLLIEQRQADVDLKKAQAASNLINSLKDTDAACMLMGSILVVKTRTVSGTAIVSRTLSQREMKIIERFPEVLRHPDKVMEALSAADVRELPDEPGGLEG